LGHFPPAGGGALLGKYQSRTPTTAKPLYHSFFSPIGGASLLGVMICTPAGGALLFCEEK